MQHFLMLLTIVSASPSELFSSSAATELIWLSHSVVNFPLLSSETLISKAESVSSEIDVDISALASIVPSPVVTVPRGISLLYSKPPSEFYLSTPYEENTL